jgi:hypothetical protein
MAKTPETFDASTLAPYTVIRVPQAFEDQEPGPKRLIVIGHLAGVAVCVKATSKTAVYKNNPEMRESGVLIPIGKYPACFPKETIIQPDNQTPISHAKLNDWHRKGELDIFGALPQNEFEPELLKAADGERIRPEKKKRIVTLLEANAKQKV